MSTKMEYAAVDVLALVNLCHAFKGQAVTFTINQSILNMWEARL